MRPKFSRHPLPQLGDRYGQLTVMGIPQREPGQRQQIEVRCDCGTERTVEFRQLSSGHLVSCGCAKNDGRSRRTHGEWGTRIWRIWRNMCNRCHNPKTPRYGDYGGRGIMVCSEWREYVPFRDWALSNGYADDLQIERRDNDAGYAPENCLWVTRAMQAHNKRNNRLFTAFGESKRLDEWAKDARCTVPLSALKWRVYADWDIEYAICTPSGQ